MSKNLCQTATSGENFGCFSIVVLFIQGNGLLQEKKKYLINVLFNILNIKVDNSTLSSIKNFDFFPRYQIWLNQDASTSHQLVMFFNLLNVKTKKNNFDFFTKLSISDFGTISTIFLLRMSQ